ILAQQRVLGRDRFLDLHDHVVVAPDLLLGRNDLGARLDVRLVGDRGALTGSLLDAHVVAPSNEGRDAGRGHADAEFLSLDLFGYADSHVDGRQHPPAFDEDQWSYVTWLT